MPKITIPENITLSIPVQNSPEPRLLEKSFTDFVLERLDDTQFGRSIESLEARKAIRKAFSPPPAVDQVVELRQEDWSLLASAVKNPGNPYIPALGERILPYIYAVVNPK